MTYIHVQRRTVPTCDFQFSRRRFAWLEIIILSNMIAWTVPNGYVVCNKQWFMYKLWTFLFVYLDFPDLPESLSGSNPLSRRRILPTPPSAVNSQWILASNNSRLIRVGHGSGPSTGRVRLGRVGSGQEIWTHVQLWQKYLRNDLVQLTGER